MQRVIRNRVFKPPPWNTPGLQVAIEGKNPRRKDRLLSCLGYPSGWFCEAHTAIKVLVGVSKEKKVIGHYVVVIIMDEGMDSGS
jgi:hypothetical protein